MEYIETMVENVKEDLKNCEYLLIGLGREWERADAGMAESAYQILKKLTDEKNYFIVTTCTDGRIFDYLPDKARITAPCGNVNWVQCPDACTRDIWEKGEVTDGHCPHCGKELVSNTIACDNYIEEGYLPQWKEYQEWLAHTLNRRLLLLELGVDFQAPTVIRWPFEKTAFFNQKSHMYRVSQKFYQITEELKERGVSDRNEFTGIYSETGDKRLSRTFSCVKIRTKRNSEFIILYRGENHGSNQQ